MHTAQAGTDCLSKSRCSLQAQSPVFSQPCSPILTPMASASLRPRAFLRLGMDERSAAISARLMCITCTLSEMRFNVQRMSGMVISGVCRKEGMRPGFVLHRLLNQ